MLLRIALLLLALASGASAQTWFRYYVTTPFKSAKVAYEESYDLTMARNPGMYRLSLSNGLAMAGCAQDSFTYTGDRFSVDISPSRAEWLIGQIRAMPLRKLNRKQSRHDASPRSWGWIDLDDKFMAYIVGAPKDQPELVKLRTLLDEFAKEAGAKAEHERRRITLEGDAHPARPVTIATLLQNPHRYDGKRVRVSGFWRMGFEESNFGPAPDAPFERSLWLGGHSAFADPKQIHWRAASRHTVDGVFRDGPAGHLGVWPGELTLLTRVAPARVGGGEGGMGAGKRD